ncbi:hypothetical protein BDA99DRAFT_513578 [Phascolomyces articulosus]|uniref:DUF4097 domain-containing protein n=1 Tax=Phascolomyces articulosus TaxID=60185 RepID=A0AAD5K7Z7_9FUNG|nr:hypothetical protein BDA99DRAFT_513578 [Phascolomyces articulosus]
MNMMDSKTPLLPSNTRSTIPDVDPHTSSVEDTSFLGIESSTSSVCWGNSDSWEKVTSEFTAPSSIYNGLDVEQKASRYINFQSGEANVLVDESIEETTIRFDMAFQNPEDQDFIEIRKEERAEGILRLVVDVKHPVPEHICMKLDITVTLSSAGILDTLSIEAPNEAVTVHGEHNPVFFNILALSTANGRITTTESVTGGKVIFSTANGEIIAKGLTGNDVTLSTANGNVDVEIDTLSGNLVGSTANGKIAVNVAAITGTSSKVQLSTANGKIAATLPDSFESSFDINSVIGKVSVESINHPEKIHFKEHHNALHMSGYYGDIDKKTENRVEVSSVVGGSSIVFA